MYFRNSNGLISIFFSSFLFGFTAVFIKILSSAIPASEILLMRAAIGIIFILCLIYLTKSSLKVHNINMCVVRGGVGGIAVFLYFIAIARIPLSSAALLANTYPLFATLFSFFMFKEKPKLDAIIALIIAFIGIYLILDPDFSKLDIGYFLAFLSGLLAGLTVSAIRELRKTDGSWVIVMSFLIGSLVFALPFSFMNFKAPDFNQWIMLLAIGIITTIGQGYFTSPFKHVKVTEGGTLALADTAFTILFSVLILREVLSKNFILGAILVFIGSAYLIMRGQEK